MSNDTVPTWVYTTEGELPFQEYFVHRQCLPQVSGFRFSGAEMASPAPGVLEALERADLIIICPSNPWVSIDPILAIPGIRPLITSRRSEGRRPVVAVSPIIGGKTIKGPAAKMYAELGITPSALSVARHYGSLLAGFVFDKVDLDQTEAVRKLEVFPLTTETVMATPDDRRRLADEVLAFGASLMDRIPSGADQPL